LALRGFGAVLRGGQRDAHLLDPDFRLGVLRGAAQRELAQRFIVFVLSADGQVDVGERTLPPSPTLARLVHHTSGEGRFRWLHARAGAAAELAAAAHEAHDDIAWVVTREQTLDEQWFGPVVSPPVQARLGDVAMVTHADVSFDDPADTGPHPLVCRHGSLTAAEVYVPLLAAVG
jgi:hypothetical protein